MNEFLKELKELCEKHNAHIVASGGHDPEGWDAKLHFIVRHGSIEQHRDAPLRFPVKQGEPMKIKEMINKTYKAYMSEEASVTKE